jgi:hypothetical protein
MPSRFSNNFFRNLYDKAKSWLGFGSDPEQEVEPLYQEPEEIVDDQFVVDEEDPMNIPPDEEMGELQELETIQDPMDVQRRLRDMLAQPPEQRDLPQIDGFDPQDSEEAIKREPEEDKPPEEERPRFPDGRAGYRLKIDYAIDKGLVLNVDYIGPHARFGPNYKIKPLEWSIGNYGPFVWVKDVEDTEVAVKMFYLSRFRDIQLP